MEKRTAVLVAENDWKMAKELSIALSRHGWQVIHVRDAVSATAAVLRQRPEAVILNSQLPGGGGLLALKRLRASVHTAMTPVIAIASGKEGDVDELRRHGADECVLGPPDAAAVADWVLKRLAEPVPILEAPTSIIRDPERLASLARTDLLDSPPSEALDTLTRMAAALLNAPVALVSLVDKDRQFFKSHIGLPEPWATRRETPLTHSFCQWVVSGHEALIVSDAREHSVLRHNRALHELGVIAYAGVPLTGSLGDPIGAFCAVDIKPRTWSEGDVALLRQLSLVVEACIAVGESRAPQGATENAIEAESVGRSVVMRAVGEGISAITEILRRDHPRLGGPERKALLNLVDWLGRHIIQLAAA